MNVKKFYAFLLCVALSTIFLVSCNDDENDTTIIYGNYEKMYYNRQLLFKYYYDSEGKYMGYRRYGWNWDSLQLTYDNAGRPKFRKKVSYTGSVSETEYVYHDNGLLDYTLESGYKTVYSFENGKIGRISTYNTQNEESYRKTFDYTSDGYVYKNYTAPDFTNPDNVQTHSIYKDYTYEDPKLLPNEANYYLRKLIKSRQTQTTTTTTYNEAFIHEFDSQNKLIKTIQNSDEYTFEY